MKKIKRTLNARLLNRLIAYSDRYEINMQLWPEHISVYIAKDDVELQSWGSDDSNFAIAKAIEYLDRINKQL